MYEKSTPERRGPWISSGFFKSAISTICVWRSGCQMRLWKKNAKK
jgi:hypothetical protein